MRIDAARLFGGVVEGTDEADLSAGAGYEGGGAGLRELLAAKPEPFEQFFAVRWAVGPRADGGPRRGLRRGLVRAGLNGVHGCGTRGRRNGPRGRRWETAR